MAKDKNIRKRRRTWQEYQKLKARTEKNKQRDLTIRKLRELQEEQEMLDD